MSIRTRLDIIGMALCGPATTGPYGPAVAPPAPRPRDARGRLLSRQKIEEITRMSAIAKATAIAGLDSARQTVSDALTPTPVL